VTRNYNPVAIHTIYCQQSRARRREQRKKEEARRKVTAKRAEQARWGLAWLRLDRGRNVAERKFLESESEARKLAAVEQAILKAENERIEAERIEQQKEEALEQERLAADEKRRLAAEEEAAAKE
jgi:hypothetical protein